MISVILRLLCFGGDRIPSVVSIDNQKNMKGSGCGRREIENCSPLCVKSRCFSGFSCLGVGEVSQTIQKALNPLIR